MRKVEFENIVASLPGLTANGFLSPLDPEYAILRASFENSAIYLQHALDAHKFLSKFKPTVLMTKWQKENCTPENLKGLIQWDSGRDVSIGAIVVAAVYLGFRLYSNDREKPSLNIFAPQLEGELRNFRIRELIKQAVGQ